MTDIELQRYKLMPQLGLVPHPEGKWVRWDQVLDIIYSEIGDR